MDLERLDALRREIREVTEEIIRLVGKRLWLVEKINDIKIKAGIPIRNLTIEAVLKRSIVELCDKYRVTPGLGLRILNLLIKESIKIQEKAREKR